MNAPARAYQHRGGEPALLGRTIAEHFADVVRRFPEREAVVCVPQARRLDYATLAAESDRVARGLVALGFARGDRLGIWSTNNVEWLLVQLATARIGVNLVNVNPAYRPQELGHAMTRSELHGLVLIPRFRSSDYVAELCEVVPELRSAAAGEWRSPTLPALRRAIVYDPRDAPATARPAPGFDTWGELLAAGEPVSRAALDAASAALDLDDAINIQFTSGTTGFPKAVVLSHHGILNNAWFAARAMRFDEHDRLCIPVPFYHCFGMVLANLLCLSVGACAVIACEHFDAEAVLEAIQAERCTALHGVPTMFIAALEHPRFESFDLSSLRTGIMAGAPCPPALMRRVMSDMHCAQILIGYGETEASPLTHLTAIDDSVERRTETVGTNLPHQEVKIVDVAGGATLGRGETGEICFRGYHVMKGYHGDAQATAEAVDADGWLRSGDLGVMDADGYLRVTGRRKEMIIRGGENIYPREIEEVLFAHPKVAQAAVFGVPDEFYGEQVAAWVQLHPGEQADEDEMRAFCRERMAHFKVPHTFRFVTEFPMTVTGKLQKFRMREMTLGEGDAATAAGPAPAAGPGARS